MTRGTRELPSLGQTQLFSPQRCRGVRVSGLSSSRPAPPQAPRIKGWASAQPRPREKAPAEGSSASLPGCHLLVTLPRTAGFGVNPLPPGASGQGVPRTDLQPGLQTRGASSAAYPGENSGSLRTAPGEAALGTPKAAALAAPPPPPLGDTPPGPSPARSAAGPGPLPPAAGRWHRRPGTVTSPQPLLYSVHVGGGGQSGLPCAPGKAVPFRRAAPGGLLRSGTPGRAVRRGSRHGCAAGRLRTERSACTVGYLRECPVNAPGATGSCCLPKGSPCCASSSLLTLGCAAWLTPYRQVHGPTAAAVCPWCSAMEQQCCAAQAPLQKPVAAVSMSSFPASQRGC